MSAGLTPPPLPHEFAERGYAWELLNVVEFHDTDDSKRWFWRDHSELGAVWAVCDGRHPIDPAEVKRVALDTYGPRAEILW